MIKSNKMDGCKETPEGQTEEAREEAWINLHAAGGDMWKKG